MRSGSLVSETFAQRWSSQLHRIDSAAFVARKDQDLRLRIYALIEVALLVLSYPMWLAISFGGEVNANKRLALKLCLYKCR